MKRRYLFLFVILFLSFACSKSSESGSEIKCESINTQLKDTVINNNLEEIIELLNNGADFT